MDWSQTKWVVGVVLAEGIREKEFRWRKLYK